MRPAYAIPSTIATRVARALRVALVAAAALVWPASQAAAQGNARAEVTATQEKGFGRITVSFTDRTLLPQFTTRVSGNVLVVQFAEPVTVDVDRLPTLMPAYVQIARRDPDGQALRFALTRQVKVNTLEAGEKLFIDLLPPTWAGPPPGLPDAVVQELARRAEAALKAQREAEKQRFGLKVLPKLDFRVGRHPTFTRFSFGWNVPFDTQLAREDDRVVLTFNRMAEIDFAPVLTDPPPALKEIAGERDGDKLKIVMTIAPEADVRAFREDQSYVVDLSLPGKPANAAEAAVRKALAESSGVGERARELVTAPAAPASSKGAAPHGDAALTGLALPSPQAPAAAPAKGSAPKPAQPAFPRAAEAGAPGSKAADPAPAAHSPAAAPGTGAAEGQEMAKGPADDQGGEADPTAQHGEGPQDTTAARSTDLRIVRVEAKRIGNIVRIAFPFAGKVASAAFKRDDALWVVFDSEMQFDTRAIGASLGPLARSVTVTKTERGQAIRILLGEPMLTTLGADGNSWILTIGEMVLEPARPLSIQRVFRGGGQGALKVELADAGSVHEIQDPVVGDRMVVVTALGPARGILKPYSYSELDTVPSAHGVAVVPRTDDLSVSLEPGQVVISRERGLNLSTGSLTQPPDFSIPNAERKKARRLVDPSVFAIQDPADFTARIRSLIEKVGLAPEPQKNAARFDLAEFYIAHRFGPEALGVLRLIASQEPGIERDPGFIVLFAAAQTMTGRTAEARRALGRSEVADNADAALWRTIAAAAEQKWDEARESASKAAGAVGGYPPDVRALFGLAAAEAAVELNDFATAQSRLAEIEPDEVETDLRARYELLQARVADAAGRPEDATERYQRVIATGDRMAGAEAEYRRLRQLVRDARIPPEEAIDRLKSLAFDWRGDEIELKTLRFLANLQSQHGLWRDAFQSMRAAVMVAPDASTTRLLQDEMGREFVSLYLDNKADRLSPVDALTLYYDFRDLTPIGRLGDEIVRKIADRLVGVDLLDPAAELLTYQIDNRLRGAARAQIAADLAVVHLLDRKPDKALAVLNKTRQSQLPTSVERQRRMVEARALSETGRGDVALELVGSLGGTDVDRLRADILWRSKRWREAGERLETMLGGRWTEGPPLDPQERQDVLRAAVAYSLGNDSLGLGRLRGKFAEKMAAGPNAAAFEVVTAPIQSQGNEFRSIAREIAAVDTMRNFLEEYRSQYMKPADQPKEPEKKDKAPPGPQAADRTPAGTRLAAAEPPADKGGEKPAEAASGKAAGH
ncbi:tetratricopeptide repeat protein [Prosthecomicrobium sp. N25]|uniref:tetratricopeptide repeat protein n=1 Tax=Prosthecomicrobium sp. N25 TaxID=3129254 RepID=UPI003077E79B